MKKIFLLVPIIICLTVPLPRANAQITAVIAAMDAGTIAWYAEQAVYWGQQLKNLAKSVEHAKDQFDAMIRAEERALKNIQGITNVESWDDLMSWTNRQIYLERQAEARFNTIGVKIGDKNYKIKDIADIPEALKDTYLDFWNKDFTEAQRREMWYRLGLTPANYNYIQVWKKRERDFIEKYMTKTEVINEEYMDTTARLAEIRQDLAADRDNPEIGEKELLSMNVEMMTLVTKGIVGIDATLAEMQEQKAIEMMQNNAPPSSPPLSPGWNESYFSPMR